MDCPTCGTTNDPGRKFCGECGTALATSCPSCGASNAPGVKFCGECGTDLRAPGAAAPAGRRDAPTAERRLVSILFADLVGFTPLSESRDAETVRDLLDRYFATATQIIDSYGGTIEKFIGDAVMAVWGAPTAFEDDAERAVRSALDLVAAVEALGHELGAELQLRAGVLTGEAAVTLGATNQGMVAGDLVNTAARLQSVAPPGTVLVGDATYQAASEAIAFEPAGEQLLKGKAAPVPAYRALRVVARRGGSGRIEQLEAPFVGRAPELRMLKDFHIATGAERRPRLVSIIGQGGIGKSRLIWEFQKYLDGVTEVVYWHQGRSPAYGVGISFWALAEMVRGRIGITDEDDPAAARSRLSGALVEFVTDEAERRWMEPRLLQLLGIEGGEGAEPSDRESLFAAWRLLFERIAEHGVVVLVFEDLQWADDGLLDFIDHVLDWSRERPIYIITSARPELLDRRRDWGAGRRNFTSLVLEPLTAEQMRELLAGLVPGLPAPVMERVLDRAEGIPLYAVETVRMLLADGLVTLDDGIYRPTGDLSDLSVPASLHALIASRLDNLDPADRSLLQAASVIGKTFGVGCACGGERPHARRAGRAAAWPRSSRDADARGGSAVARAWPVRVRPGSHPRGRLRDARQARSAADAHRGGALLRVARRRGHRRRPRRALRGGLQGPARRPRGSGGRRPGPRRAARGRGACPVARFVRAGDAVPRAGPRGDDGPGRRGSAPCRRRRGRPQCGAPRGADRAHGQVARADARSRWVVPS